MVVTARMTLQLSSDRASRLAPARNTSDAMTAVPPYASGDRIPLTKAKQWKSGGQQQTVSRAVYPNRFPTSQALPRRFLLAGKIRNLNPNG